MTGKVTNTNQNQGSPIVAHRTTSSSSVTFAAARALHSVENSPKKTGGLKRSAEHLQSNEQFSSVEKAAKIAAPFQNENDPHQITVTFPNGSTYTGQWLNNKMQGHGTYIDANKNMYVGQFKDGNIEGFGTFTYHNGSTYVGQLQKGKFNGQGKYTHTDKTTQEGQFKDDKFLPFETVNFETGQYVGQRVDGNFNGQGIFTWKSGSKYVGQFVNGKFHGPGILILVNGDEYVGQFVNGKREGKGTLMTIKGDRIKGSFANDKIHGHAIHTFANGDRYEGQFVNDRKQGECTWKYANGEVYVGSYGNNQYQGYGVLTRPNGSKYEGSWKDGKMHGHGTHTYGPSNHGYHEKKSQYSGHFNENKRCGQGTLDLINGDCYVGEFKDDYYHGRGNYMTQNSLYLGFFYQGQKHGFGVRFNLNTKIMSSGYYRKNKQHPSFVEGVALQEHSLEDLAEEAVKRL